MQKELFIFYVKKGSIVSFSMFNVICWDENQPKDSGGRLCSLLMIRRRSNP